MTAFTTPDVAAALKRPTIQITDPGTGYVFDTSSPEWKNACAPLPAFAGLHWPGYATACVADTIDGTDVVIQVWMGYCERFLARADFPGGMGGEVGVYAKVPGGRPLPDLEVLPFVLRPVFSGLEHLDPDELWWPDAGVQPPISFTIQNPITGAAVVSAGVEDDYWVNRWMEPSSYEQYKEANVGRLPSLPTQYRMVFTVAGRTRVWERGEVSPAG
jgi:hypothetical protein